MQGRSSTVDTARELWSALARAPSRPRGVLPPRQLPPQPILSEGDALHANAQLTDGGPPPTPESPNRLSGPPFGEAPGSARSANLAVYSRRTQVNSQGENTTAVRRPALTSNAKKRSPRFSNPSKQSRRKLMRSTKCAQMAVARNDFLVLASTAPAALTRKYAVANKGISASYPGGPPFGPELMPAIEAPKPWSPVRT
jgi:hypothetical protein